MTVCNMSIEAGAKAGLIAPDETTTEPTTAEQSLDETSATLSALSDLNADLDSAGLDDLTDDLDDLDSQLNKL